MTELLNVLDSVSLKTHHLGVHGHSSGSTGKSTDTRMPAATRGNVHFHEKKSVCLASADPRHLPTIACILGVTVSLLWHSPACAYEKDTPYSQAQNQKMQMGLLNGKIRPCPSNINPNCISTTSMNAMFGIPFEIPPEASQNATRKLLSAIQTTQRNAKIMKLEDTPTASSSAVFLWSILRPFSAALLLSAQPSSSRVFSLFIGFLTGQYLEVEVDGIFGRDVMEFLVKSDVVTYRSLAGKVLYVYPFTTPLTDFGAQDKRIKAIQEELGWNAPTWDSAY